MSSSLYVSIYLGLITVKLYQLLWWCCVSLILHDPYIGLCTFEDMVTVSGLYRLALAEKGIHQSPGVGFQMSQLWCLQSPGISYWGLWADKWGLLLDSKVVQNLLPLSMVRWDQPSVLHSWAGLMLGPRSQEGLAREALQLDKATGRDSQWSEAIDGVLSVGQGQKQGSTVILVGFQSGIRLLMRLLGRADRQGSWLR